MFIQSRNVYFNEKFEALQIEVANGKIKAILAYGTNKDVKDYGDLLILPGLVDIHNHGYLNCDANHATEEWLNTWVNYLPSEGVTSTLSTISTCPKATFMQGLSNIGNFLDKEHKGSHILGVYEEGPLISVKYCGAQDTNYQIKPSDEFIDEINVACHGHLIYAMIAVDELHGNYEVISNTVKKGIRVAIGHSGATFEECTGAIRAGASSFTHTFNGMRGLHHREPGCVGAAMFYDNVYAELICDGIHVEKHAANILAKTKDKDHLILITDSVKLKGLALGEYKVDENDDRLVTICADGVGRLADGTLAGSCNKLNKVLRFAIKEAKIDKVQAINAATINPLRMLGIKNKGLIEVGYDADIAIFDDDFNTQAVYIDGKEFTL